MLAYVREYSTLSTYSDTVFLFREKMVDFMLPIEPKSKFKGWRAPRILKSKSYYRFTNSAGLDSVSDKCNYHFSWSDWLGILPTATIPPKLQNAETSTDTVFGKYSPTEIWIRKGDKLTLDLDIMADTMSRRWVPNIAAFFHRDMEFEQFHLRFNYEDIVGNSISPVDVNGYSYNIESTGRGRSMFMFNRRDEPFFVSTYAEVYMLDKEYITIAEAKKWERNHGDYDDIQIFEPREAPELLPDIKLLVDRVNTIDRDKVRLAITPDQRLIGREVVKLSFERAILQRIKGIFGIDKLIGRRKSNQEWKKFRRETIIRNNQKSVPSEPTI